MPGGGGPGPSTYNEFRVLEVGPERAKNVLVLEPGTSAGAACFRLDAEALVQRLPGWQVWSLDRRENLLEDHSVLDPYLTGSRTSQQVFDYYLGWLSNPKVSRISRLRVTRPYRLPVSGDWRWRSMICIRSFNGQGNSAAKLFWAGTLSAARSPSPMQHGTSRESLAATISMGWC
jgi:hypothetical protein